MRGPSRQVLSVEHDPPAMAGRRPAIVRKRVVFPAPFEPMIATASPVRTSTSMSVDDPFAEVPGR